MTANQIRLNDLNPIDLERHWLWEYAPSPDGELWLKPIKVKTTSKIEGRLAGCKVSLADGSLSWALIIGIDPMNFSLRISLTHKKC